MAEDHDKMVELVARVLCWNKVSCADKIEANGLPRWTWYRSEAERFVSIHKGKIEELTSASLQE